MFFQLRGTAARFSDLALETVLRATISECHGMLLCTPACLAANRADAAPMRRVEDSSLSNRSNEMTVLNLIVESRDVFIRELLEILGTFF